MTKRGIVLLVFAFFLLVFIGNISAANCVNRDTINSTGCTCNGIQRTSGYCCYYDPAAGNITWQSTDYCGYTKYSPHEEYILTSKDEYTWDAMSGLQRDWVANNYDFLILDSGLEYKVDWYKPRNPTALVIQYRLDMSIPDFLDTVTKGVLGSECTQYTGAYSNFYQNLQNYATAHGYNLEDAFLHASENTAITIRGQSYIVPGCDNTTRNINCRIGGYLPGFCNRWLFNYKSNLTRAFFAYEWNRMTNNNPYATNNFDGIFLDEHPLFANHAPIVTSGGKVLEYNNLSFSADSWAADPPSESYPLENQMYSDLVGLMQVEKNAMGPGKYLIPNHAIYGARNPGISQSIAADGGFLEFNIDPGITIGYRTSTPNARHEDIGSIADMSKYLYNNGKIVIFVTMQRPADGSDVIPGGYTAGSYSSTSDRVKVYELGYYYSLKDVANKYAYFNTLGDWSYNGMVNSKAGAQNVDIGRATGDYYVYQNGTDPNGHYYQIWARDFGNALVLFRPWEHGYTNFGDATAVTANLSQMMTPIHSDGSQMAPVNRFTLRNSEAVILLKQVVGYPDVEGVQCNDGTNWVNCNSLLYNSKITQVRANCTDDGSVSSSTFSLMNSEDNTYFFNAGYTSHVGSQYVYDVNPDLTIRDSGNFILNVACTDNQAHVTNDQTSWTIPWGTLSATHNLPLNNSGFNNGSAFVFQTTLTCTGGECGNISATLDPTFGNQGATEVSFWPEIINNQKMASRYLMNNEVGILRNITFPGIQVRANSNISAAIYADNGGVPGNKIADALNVYRSAADQKLNLVFNFSGASLTANTYYWFALGVQIDPASPNKVWWYETALTGSTVVSDGIPVSSNSFGTPTSTSLQYKRGYAYYDIDASYKTVVPMNSGSPFYTTSANPNNQSCLNLGDGNSCVTSWNVVANGQNNNYTFYTIYNPVYSGVTGIQSPHVKIFIGQGGKSADANKDGRIDVVDLAIVIYNQGRKSTDANWGNYQHLDLDNDNNIDLDDAGIVMANII
jgi:hypothetical protein